MSWFQVLPDSLHPHCTRASWWSHPVLRGGKLLRSSWHLFRLAFVQCGWAGESPYLELDNSRRSGCLIVARVTSSLCTWWSHLIPSSFHKHHWSRASILSASHHTRWPLNTWFVLAGVVWSDGQSEGMPSRSKSVEQDVPYLPRRSHGTADRQPTAQLWVRVWEVQCWQGN